MAFFKRTKKEEVTPELVTGKPKGQQKDEFKDDFNFEQEMAGLDFDDASGPREPNTKELAKIAATSLGKSLAETTGKEAKQRILGDKFNRDADTVKGLVSETASEVKEAGKEIRKSLVRAMPKRMRDKLKIKYDEGPGYQERSQEQIREDLMKNQSDKIFNRQQKGNYLDDEETNASEQIGVETMISSKLLTNITRNMNRNIATLTGFFMETGNEYFRKSLELQYRSYYVQIDLLKTVTNMHAGGTKQLDAIIKNTALPEHVKINNAERLESRIKENFSQKIYDTMFTNNEYLNALKENVKNKIRSKKNEITGQLDTISNAREMLASTEGLIDPKELKAQGIGDAAGGFLGKIAGKALDNKYGEKVRGSKLYKNTAKTLDVFANHTPSALAGTISSTRDLSNRLSAKKGIGSRLGGKLFGGISSLLEVGNLPGRDIRLGQEEINSFSNPAVFDKNVYRHITEGIPLYLSKILVSTQEIAGKYSFVNRRGLKGYKGPGANAEGLLYNLQDRKLSSLSEYRDSVGKSVGRITDRGRDFSRVGRGILSDSRSLLKKGGVESVLDVRNVTGAKAEGLMSDYIEHFSNKSPEKANFENLIKNALDPNNNDLELKDYLSKRPELTAILQSIKRAEEFEGEDTISISKRSDKQLNEARAVYPTEVIKKLFYTIDLLSGMESKDIKEFSENDILLIAKSFSTYVLRTNNPISFEPNELSQAFYYMSQNNFDRMEPQLLDFMSKVNALMTDGDYSMKMSVKRAFAIVTTAISEKVFTSYSSRDNRVDMFRNIENFNRGLMGERKMITTDALVSGRISDDMEDEETVRGSSLAEMSLLGTSLRERNNPIENAFGKMDDSINEIKVNFGLKKATAMKKFDKMSKVVIGISEKSYEEISKRIGGFSTIVDNIREGITALKPENIDSTMQMLGKRFNFLRETTVKMVDEERKVMMEKIRNAKMIYKDNPDMFKDIKAKAKTEFNLKKARLFALGEEIGNLSDTVLETKLADFPSMKEYKVYLKDTVDNVVLKLKASIKKYDETEI